MVALLEIGLLALIVILVVGAYIMMKAVKPLIVNTVIGLIVLFLAQFVGLGVNITPIVILIVAFGGLPGAILIIILAQFQILFEPALILF